MRLTSRMLRRIIAEEIQNLNNRQIVAEGTSSNPIRVTPEYINGLIREELELFQRKQRLAESRRRRALNSYYY